MFSCRLSLTLVQPTNLRCLLVVVLMKTKPHIPIPIPIPISTYNCFFFPFPFPSPFPFLAIQYSICIHPLSPAHPRWHRGAKVLALARFKTQKHTLETREKGPRKRVFQQIFFGVWVGGWPRGDFPQGVLCGTGDFWVWDAVHGPCYVRYVVTWG